ncbi:signal peptidase [Peribacillus deserti]|uniref:Signal peptidase I n=1 Tax=Peribacillus deserti TaxID=673318 RepID=A0ABS2QDL7_9BACI|nr:signal peptidase I [Peribacillus deserti]MBM7690899.1 signal peptidase [Peribacillus deserti]
MKKVLKILSNTLTYVLFAVFLLMLFLVISSKASGGEPQAFGYQLKTVLSGSMEPTFQTGSIIAVKPLNTDERKSLKKGSIITFRESEEKLITHRVTKVLGTGQNVSYETKGDNNDATDLQPVLSQNVVAQYDGFTIPYAGYFISYASSKTGSALMMVVPGLLILLYAGYTIFQAIREIDSKTKNTETTKTA